MKLKAKDFIGVAGILLFAATFTVDKLIVTIPTAVYLPLLGISMILLIAGMVNASKRRRD